MKGVSQLSLQWGVFVNRQYLSIVLIISCFIYRIRSMLGWISCNHMHGFTSSFQENQIRTWTKYEVLMFLLKSIWYLKNLEIYNKKNVWRANTLARPYLFVVCRRHVSRLFLDFWWESLSAGTLIHGESNVITAVALFVSCSWILAPSAAPSLSTTNYLGNQAMVVPHCLLPSTVVGPVVPDY